MLSWMILRSGLANTAAIVALGLLPLISVAFGGLGSPFRSTPIERVALAQSLQLGDGIAD